MRPFWVLINLLPKNRLSLGFEVEGGLFDAVGHAGFAFFEVGSGVVVFFVAYFAFDFKYAVVVFKHMVNDGFGEGVLGVGVDVHLDDAVAQGFLDLLLARAGAAVEDQVHLGLLAVFAGDYVLAGF